MDCEACEKQMLASNTKTVFYFVDDIMNDCNEKAWSELKGKVC